MADRYWVGGTGTWDGTSTANWSTATGLSFTASRSLTTLTTVGSPALVAGMTVWSSSHTNLGTIISGSGNTWTMNTSGTVASQSMSAATVGASVPTASDSVFFDANSNSSTTAFTVTMATTPRVCNDFTASGLDGTMTLAGTSIGLTVSGSLTFQATNFTRTYTGATTFNATTTGKTVTTNGVAFGNSVTFNGVGGGWTLGSALTVSSTAGISFLAGTFDTSAANNYSVTTTGIFGSSGVFAKTINLNASTVTISLQSNIAINIPAGTTNLTFNAGTSQINLSAAAGSGITSIGLVFYNVAFTGTTTGSSKAITGVNTFNNLSVTGSATAGVTTVTFAANQTINGALSTTGTAGNRRVWFSSATYGIGFTLTCNSAASLTDADFRDIYVIGTAAPISGTRIGNRGNCSGITFDAAKTVYWNLAGAQNWSANAWATTSTGTPSTDNFPLPQDTATFTNAGSVTGTITLDTAIGYCSTVDMSGRTTAMTIGTSNVTTVYGNWTNGSGTAFTGTSALTFSGGTTQTITSASKTFSGPITVDTYGGTVQLADALNIGGNTLTVTNGTFTTAGFAVTANILTSSNSNVRTINLGASTVTLASITLTTSTNLTFNAGTSQINYSSTANFSASGQTFYNVSYTSNSSVNTIVFSGANTFNNLSFAAPLLFGFKTITFSANQIINGTLTCSTSDATHRAFLASDTIGTQRTLTVNSLSATDTDFRDIVIAGTAAGSSPTRAGDCGNNSGITFPAPKTVYWNLAGTQNWTATGWCTASGGTPAVNNFPLAQDTAVFDDAGSAGTVTINFSATQTTWNIGTFDASLRTSAMTFSTSVYSISVYGNWLFGTGVTSSSTTGTVIFSKNGTQTITSNGVQFGCPVTINHPSANVQLADALSLGATRSLTLTTGTFDAVSYNVTTGGFAGAASTTLKMGSGTWTLSGTGIVWTAVSTTTVIVGTSTIILSDTSTTARTFAGGNLYYNKLTIGGATGTSTLTISGTNTFGELASTKTVAHTILFTSSTTYTIGKWSVTGTAGNVVTVGPTTAATVYTLSIAGPANTGIDYLSISYCTVSATSVGEFYVGANSTNTAGNTGSIFFTATPAARTLYWVGGTGNWSATTSWATLSGGASGAAIPTSLDSVNFDSLSNATAYTATIDAGVALARCAAFSMAGPLVGNVTWAGTVGIAFHGNILFAATGITRSYTGAMNWAGNASYTFTPNGLTFFTNGITVNGIGSTWTLGSDLFNYSGGFTVTYGTFSTSASNYFFGVSVFQSSNSNVRAIVLNGSTGSISLPNGFTTTTNLTFSAGTSTLNLSGSSMLFGGGGQTFYIVNFTDSSAQSIAILGENTFNTLSFASRTASVGITPVTFSANQTIGTLTLNAGTTAAYRTFLASDTIGTTRTLTVNALTAGAADYDFRDITIAGAAAPISGTRLGDCKGNSGITFPAAKTVYYRQTATFSDWGSTGSGSWSATSGGALDATQFPLAQDTAVFPAATYPPSGAQVTTNGAYNIGTIDMSLRTSNTMTFASNAGLQVYGNWINGTGITMVNTTDMLFSGRTTQTITSANVTFTYRITVNSPNGSVSLQDDLTLSYAASGALTITAGTFSASNYNVTLTSSSSGVSSTGTSIRTIAIGSGTWTLPGASTVWSAATSTNLTVTGTGTGTISLTSASAKTFAGGSASYSGITLNQGGAGTLTITGNNTFANITNTSGVATTLNLGGTTQTVGAFAAAGTVGNLLTITGTSAASPATLIYTGVVGIAGLDYLVPTSIRVYPTTSIWFAGANSTNGGSLGWIFAVGGSVVYNAFFIDTATATDSPSVAASTFNAPVEETATATDAISGGFLYVSTVADSATATDVITNAGSIYNAPVADLATATDLILGLAAFSSALAETATASDSILGLAAFSSALAETATATDSLLVAPSTFNAPVAETATATDSPSVAASTFNAPVTETATATDLILGLAAFSSALSETATAADSILGLAAFSSALSETATATDSVLSFADFYAALAETATATDSPLVAPSTFNAPIAETATATDSPLVAPSTFNAPVSETVTISDLVLGLYLWNLIDDSQSVTWQNINSSPGTTWSPIDTDPDTGWSVIPTVN
jgi:hypothetical protein